MASLDSIKNRIKTVKTTSKITGAMKLVATAKLKKEKEKFVAISNYCHDFYNIIEDLVKNDLKENKSILQIKNQKDATL